MTSTYNSETKKWDEATGEGSVEYKFTEHFADSIDSDQYIDDLAVMLSEASYDYLRSETHYLESGDVDHVLDYDVVTKYYAKRGMEPTAGQGGSAVDFKSSCYESCLSIDANWCYDAFGMLYGDWIASRSGTLKEEDRENFSLGEGGNDDFDSLSRSRYDKIDGCYTECLEFDDFEYEMICYCNEIFEDLLWNEDGYWVMDTMTSTRESCFDESWTKSGCNENTRCSVGGAPVAGTVGFEEEYSYHKDLKKTYTLQKTGEASTTGSGSENISSSRCDWVRDQCIARQECYENAKRLHSLRQYDRHQPGQRGIWVRYHLFRVRLRLLRGDFARIWLPRVPL